VDLGISIIVTAINRSDLIKNIAERYPQLNTADVEMAVKIIQETLVSALSNGSRIEIRGFGSFSLRYRKPRLGRNPKNGEQVNLNGKFVPCFKPSRELNRKLNPGRKF